MNIITRKASTKTTSTPTNWKTSPLSAPVATVKPKPDSKPVQLWADWPDVLRNLAPLYLMCDPGDIQVSAESRSPLTQAPTVVVYERVAAGVGFSQRLYELHDILLAAALELVSDCRCRDGCPACVGPPGEIGPETKAVTRRLLRMLIQR
ncbi:MAG: DUF1998 domain-containing protein [Chloroflexi bacterium]|nr:DUF1998 domain-containing protein [Chloroflexota bacterium]